MSSPSLLYKVSRIASKAIPGCRSYHASSALNRLYSSYEYPLAREAPEIKQTKASEVETSKVTKSSKIYSPNDPFDDSGSLSETEREFLRQAQRQHISTKVGSTPITPERPASIPPNVDADELETPETILTTLENGVRVVSQETYGQVSTVGVVCSVASRLEQPHQTGVTNLLELLAFGSCHKYNAMEITQLLQDWGGTRFCNTGREQSLYCIDLLRPNVDKALELLYQALMEPSFLDFEVEDAKRALEFQIMDMPPELVLSEALQTAAFGKHQQLGKPHFVPDVSVLQNLTSDTVRDYWNREMIENPQGLVIAGAGVRHDFLVEQTMQLFGHLKQGSPTAVAQSEYHGGQDRRQMQTLDGFTRVAIALPVGGWHSDDLVATCVLQTLLGGGNSFSAGGPGKGMYSRLYREVLNRYSWAESAEAFTAFYAERGMWGISGSTYAYKARDMVQVFSDHLSRLAVEPVSDEELSRARNMLKNNVLTQLESRLVLFEDLGRQVLTYGKREDMHTTCEKIDAVTKEDLQTLARKSLTYPPTIACVGNDISHVPQQDEVAAWFH